MKIKTYILYINGELSDNPDDEFENFVDAIDVAKELLRIDEDVMRVDVRERTILPTTIYTFKRNWEE